MKNTNEKDIGHFISAGNTITMKMNKGDAQ